MGYLWIMMGIMGYLWILIYHNGIFMDISLWSISLGDTAGIGRISAPLPYSFLFFLVSVMILMVFVGAELAEANIACPDPCATPKGRPSSICCTPRGARESGAVGEGPMASNMVADVLWILWSWSDSLNVEINDSMVGLRMFKGTSYITDLNRKPGFLASNTGVSVKIFPSSNAVKRSHTPETRRYPGRSAGWPWSSPPPMVPWRELKWQGPSGEKLGRRVV